MIKKYGASVDFQNKEIKNEVFNILIPLKFITSKTAKQQK